MLNAAESAIFSLSAFNMVSAVYGGNLADITSDSFAARGGEEAGYRIKWITPYVINQRETGSPDSNEPAFLQALTEATGARYLKRLAPGETAMPHAPVVRLQDGSARVPPQYLLFNHTLETVQGVLDRIQYRNDILLFASTDERDSERVFIQVGIVGRENFPYNGADHPRKLLYGRKWRVERDLPTSELIQTIFLAIKCVEEHEVRELLTYKGRTIFNNHLDAPLMKEWISHQPDEEDQVHATSNSVQTLMDHVRYFGYRLRVDDVAYRKNGKVVMDVTLIRDKTISYFDPALEGVSLTVLSENSSTSALVYGLMDAILHESIRHVEENFKLDDFARFSRSITVEELRLFLKFHRDRANLDFPQNAQEAFFASARILNMAIDATRSPVLRAADLGVARYLDTQQPLGGRMPGGYVPPSDYVPSGSYS